MRQTTRTTAKAKIRSKTRDRFLPTRKRFCRFCQDKARSINYKDTKTLEMLIKERGKIVSVRSSGNCAKHQRRIAEAIKMARFISLLPYSRI
jgi:small subunit ribosomal protein S18